MTIKGVLGTAAVLVLSGVMLSGCFTDRVTDKVSGKLNGAEFAEKFTAIDVAVNTAGEELFAALADAKPGDPIAGLSGAANAFLDAEREAAADLDDLNPPDDAENAVDALVEAATAQADAGEDVLNDPDATIQDFVDALQESDSGDAADELRGLGYAPPN